MPNWTFPESLTPAEWARDKGKIAKMDGATGIGAALTALDTARVTWMNKYPTTDLSRINAEVEQDWIDDTNPFIAAVEHVIEVAAPIATKYKNDKLIPKDSTKAVVDRINSATKLITDLKQHQADCKSLMAATAAMRQDIKKFIIANPCVLSEMIGAHVPKAFKVTKKGEVHTAPLLEFADQNAGMNAFVRQGPADKVLNIAPLVSKSAPQMTILPFQDNACTFTVLSKKALYAMTGPLSGCNIYVATCAGKEPLLMHTNCNKDSSNVPKNIKAKQDMAKAVVALYPGYAITHCLVRGTYAIPAFVFGVRGGRGWDFFSHQLNDKFAVQKRAEPLVAFVEVI